MPLPEFSPQDSQNLIALAQNAPLRNMREAEEVAKLIKRFADFYDAASQPVAPVSRKRRETNQAVPPSQEPDLTS
jgi:hypothetical protein